MKEHDVMLRCPDCGSEKWPVPMSRDAALRDPLRGLVEKWRKDANARTKTGDMREDPYDDRACELKQEGNILAKCAAELTEVIRHG